MKKILSILTMSVLLLASCNLEEVYDTYSDETALSIATISPLTATIGSEITVSGEGLQYANRAEIGGEAVEIKRKISDKELVIYASSTGVDGRITLYSAADKVSAESTENFTYEYVSPVIDETQVLGSALVGSDYFISGTYMNVVDKVYFVVEPGDGYLEGELSPGAIEAPILSQTATDLLVYVPYIPSTDASIQLEYFDGREQALSAKADAIVVAKDVPVISSTSNVVEDEDDEMFGQIAVDAGRNLTLTGVNMDNVEVVMINPKNTNLAPTAAPILEQSETELKVSIPFVPNMPDAYNETSLEVFYFDKNESTVYDKVVNVYIPEVYFYEDVFIPCRDKAMYPAAVFCLNSGETKNNGLYATEIDPVACSHEHTDPVTGEVVKGYYGKSGSGFTQTVARSANISRLTDEELYNSIEPYMLMFGLSSGSMSIDSPASTTGRYRNYYVDGGSTKLYGSTTSYEFAGTPILTYRFIDPAASADSSRELLKKFLDPAVPVGRAINKIDTSDPDNFAYYDAANQTLAGLNLNTDAGGTGMANASGHMSQPWGLVDGEFPVKNDAAPVYPNSQWTDNITGESFDYEGRVLMVNYHAWMPFDETNIDVAAATDAAKATPATIKQMGFLIIKEFYYPNNTNQAYIKGDFYWQKVPLNFKNGVLVD